MQTYLNQGNGVGKMAYTILPKSKLEILENYCSEIFEQKEVKFIGVINPLGNLIAGGFRKDVEPIGSNEKRKMMYMQLKLDLNMRNEYDDLYGPVLYVASKRKDAEKISIPIGNYMILLITEMDFEDAKINKIRSVFEPILYQN